MKNPCDNFVLIHIEYPNGHELHVFEPLIIAAVDGNSTVTDFYLVN